MDKIKYILTSICWIALCSMCFSECKIDTETIEDYLDIASSYESVNDYQKALEYINAIEMYDQYNPEIIYKKAYLLKALNKICEAEEELKKLILLNESYACSELAQTLKNPNDNSLCTARKNQCYSER